MLMPDYNDPILEKVKRLAMGQGFTEGGILKALADAANELKRQDYQFEKLYGLKERQVESQEDAALKAENQQNIMNWITGLSGLGAFGRPGTQDVSTAKYDVLGNRVGVDILKGTPGTPNWMQKLWGAGQTGGTGYGWEQLLKGLFGG